MEIFQFEQTDDALSDAVDVDWIDSIVKIFWSGVVAKKMISVKFETEAKRLIELCNLQISANVAYSAKIVTSVKIIDPGILIGFAVEPGTVRALAFHRIAGSAQCTRQILFVASKARDTTKKCCSEQVGIMNGGARRGEGIAEAANRIFLPI